VLVLVLMMMMIGKLKLLLLLVGCCIGEVSAVNVSYDHRALLLDGQRRFLISGSIHYPRSTPQVKILFTFSHVFLFVCFAF
jgi:hypothetical protein